MAQLDRDYISRGKLKYVVREFPLETIHPHSLRASQAALCAGEQGKYFAMHDILFANQQALAPEDLDRHAATAGLELSRFRECLGAATYAGQVRADLAAGQKLGIRATPSFLLGVQEGDVVQIRFRIRGAYPYATFKEAIERLDRAR